MPYSRKVLGQLDVPAITLTAVYTVPAATTAVISKIVLANRTNAGITYRVSIAVAGAVDDPKQYIRYGGALPANQADEFGGYTLGAGDVIRVYCSAINVTATVYGEEST